MVADLPVGCDLKFGFVTGFEDEIPIRTKADLAMKYRYDSIWTGDHVVVPVPMVDCFQQLAQFAALTRDILIGTSVYILPLRHPIQVAKQITSLDQLSEGRFIFGAGVGGEFPEEWAACEIPVEERGARMSAALPLVRSLVRGQPTRGDGHFFHFPETTLLPASYRPEGPPVWLGGSAGVALRRIARWADGWVGYMKTPDEYGEGLEVIATEAKSCGRQFEYFDAAHLLCLRIDDSNEAAFKAAKEDVGFGMAMDLIGATRQHAALGRPADVAEQIDRYRRAGLRHVILETLGHQDREEQLVRFAEEVRPLLR